MLKIFALILTTLSAHAVEKTTLGRYTNQSRDVLFNSLNNQGAPVVTTGKCNIKIHCAPTDCKKTVDAINTSPNVAAVSQALSSSCLALCHGSTHTCITQQLDALRNWLNNKDVQENEAEIQRQKGKKRGYKQQVRDLTTELATALGQIDAIDRRLDGYLHSINLVPNNNANQYANIRSKLEQVFTDSTTLRQQIIQLTLEIGAKDEEIRLLRLQQGIDQQRIIALEQEVRAKQTEIDQLNQQVNDLRQRFTELLNSSLDLEGIVSDFGLSLAGYTQQMQNLNGELAEKMNQLRQIVERMRQDLTQQTDERHQHYEQLRARLQTSVDDLNEQIQRTQREYDQMNDILQHMQ
jgi:DNA repair exonuclease SbcCD ATPase subunit